MILTHLEQPYIDTLCRLTDDHPAGSIAMTNPAYVLGHSTFELERLARQERLIGPSTREYFQAAGIGPGMRVLDVGSGTGVVAFLAAELVGPSGEVVGTDLAPTAVATA